MAEDDADLLSHLERLRPVVVLVAVELPAKAGFTTFSKVKKAQRNVPVVIVTSTVSRADMKMHEKLRAHANVYIDKAGLPDEELVGAIARAAVLELSIPEPAEEDATTGAMSASAGPTEAAELESPDPSESAYAAHLHPRLLELLDPETAAILAEIDEKPGRSSRPSGELSRQRIAALEEKVERREAQILVVKRRLTELATRLVAIPPREREANSQHVDRQGQAGVGRRAETGRRHSRRREGKASIHA